MHSVVFWNKFVKFLLLCHKIQSKPCGADPAAGRFLFSSEVIRQTVLWHLFMIWELYVRSNRRECVGWVVMYICKYTRVDVSWNKYFIKCVFCDELFLAPAGSGFWLSNVQCCPALAQYRVELFSDEIFEGHRKKMYFVGILLGFIFFH